ncbi:S41 family peptidase [Luteitalea sp. TBR-22]|uniref:S41 family peptidase n=1 Tax=Luteitalea sp. TBR-22 TaxID=2802971 RepID=UPI001EF3DC81|nr:S41 family peptidase [Luteitalea sp. TBR-22]
MRASRLARAFVMAVVAVACGASLASADEPPDPCNFADGSAAFSYERVMSCYERVPFNPADLANAVAFLGASRERSDLREVFQARYGWREELSALASRTFDNDHDFQLALVDNHKKFYNPHWRYRRPYCYTAYLGAFIPFDFGSTVTTVRKGGRPEQIVFIESAAYLPDLYRQFTGIDPEAYVGARVVSINGTPALEYFRQYALGTFRFDEDASQGLNEILQNAAYSIRTSVTHDVPPDRPADTFVLETRTGRRLTVEIPWVFAPREAFGVWQWPLDWVFSTEEFRAQCSWISETAWISGDFGAASGSIGASSRGDAFRRGAAQFRDELMEKREMAARLDREYHGRRADYFEVAPGLARQPLQVIVPKSDGAAAYQLGGRTTVIRLDDFVQDWRDEVVAATANACQNSDRLVFDMRNNGGGYVDSMSWLVSHVLPDRTRLKDRGLGGRFLASNPGRNELVSRMEDWSAANGSDCSFGYEGGCMVDPATEQPLAAGWYTQGNETEERGGQSELLTQRFLFRDWQGMAEPIACPGKFSGENLIIYSNGTGASAGYFWPALMRPDATIVTSGGFLGQPPVLGIARGGAVWGMNDFEAYIEQYLEYFFVPASNPLPYLIRWADSFMEQPGPYMRGESSLYVDDPARGDLHIDVWSDSPRTDSFVYGRLLEAVQRRGKAAATK